MLDKFKKIIGGIEMLTYTKQMLTHELAMTHVRMFIGDRYAQESLVRIAYEYIADGMHEVAYHIINEGFNLHMIAGYKYIELMDLLGRRGEFRSIAEENPLINL